MVSIIYITVTQFVLRNCFQCLHFVDILIVPLAKQMLKPGDNVPTYIETSEDKFIGNTRRGNFSFLYMYLHNQSLQTTANIAPKHNIASNCNVCHIWQVTWRVWYCSSYIGCIRSMFASLWWNCQRENTKITKTHGVEKFQNNECPGDCLYHIQEISLLQIPLSLQMLTLSKIMSIWGAFKT